MQRTWVVMFPSHQPGKVFDHLHLMKDLTLSHRFNQGEGQEEVAIITSSKEYVIAWDFKKVKKGRLDAYEIKKYEEAVVQDNFRYGDDKNIVSIL